MHDAKNSDMPASPPGRSTDQVQVWDWGVRGFHWLLVACVAVAGFTGFLGPLNALDVHLAAGCGIAALVGFRLVWGWLGGGYARFSSFAFRPRAVLEHARETLDGDARRHLGHNPLGAMMVFALLAVLLLIVLTGVITLGGQDKQGPLAAFVPFSTGFAMRGLHNLLAGLLVAMVVAHLAGVLFESRQEHENLTLAMINGRKRAGAKDDLTAHDRTANDPAGHNSPGPRARGGAAALLTLGGGAVIATGIALLATLPARGVPGPGLDADYARECGACHETYHPSLLPAASWQSLLDHLDTHFGEDASLDTALVEKLRAYLTANAAEHWDTLPAVMFRQTAAPDDRLRITATGFWQRMHHGIAGTVFTDKQVGQRSHCSACHGDAAGGTFSPQAIEIPENLQ